MMRRLLLACVFVTTLVGVTAAQNGTPPSDSTLLTVDRIYASPEFRSGSFGPLAWLADGSAYTTLERPAGGGAGRVVGRPLEQDR